MTILLSTKEVAEFLNVNEKMVYTLVSEKNLPASKVTGKWLFPKHLVEQWIETNTNPDTGNLCVTSRMTMVEVFSALNRRRREGNLPHDNYQVTEICFSR